MKRAIIYLLSITALGGCAGGWTPEDKDAFMQSCRAAGSRWSISPEMTDGYCYCALDKTMSHYKTIPEVPINKDSVALTAELEHCKVMAGAQ